MVRRLDYSRVMVVDIGRGQCVTIWDQIAILLRFHMYSHTVSLLERMRCIPPTTPLIYEHADGYFNISLCHMFSDNSRGYTSDLPGPIARNHGVVFPRFMYTVNQAETGDGTYTMGPDLYNEVVSSVDQPNCLVEVVQKIEVYEMLCDMGLIRPYSGANRQLVKLSFIGWTAQQKDWLMLVYLLTVRLWDPDSLEEAWCMFLEHVRDLEYIGEVNTVPWFVKDVARLLFINSVVHKKLRIYISDELPSWIMEVQRDFRYIIYYVQSDHGYIGDDGYSFDTSDDEGISPDRCGHACTYSVRIMNMAHSVVSTSLPTLYHNVPNYTRVWQLAKEMRMTYETLATTRFRNHVRDITGIPDVVCGTVILYFGDMSSEYPEWFDNIILGIEWHNVNKKKR